MHNTPIVRIQQIELKNFKNVEHGVVTMPSYKKKDSCTDILGIYGQNGTGKTAVIEAIDVIHKLLIGAELPIECGEYISKKHHHFSISIVFAFEMTDETEYLLNYSVVIEKDKSGSIILNSEKLSYKFGINKQFEPSKILFSFSADDLFKFKPASRYNALVQSLTNEPTLSKTQKMDIKKAKQTISANTLMAYKNSQSYIFNTNMMEACLANHDNSVNILTNDSSNTEDSISIASDNMDFFSVLFIGYLQAHFMNEVFLIHNAHSGAINSKFMLPLVFFEKVNERLQKGHIQIYLYKPSEVDIDKLKFVYNVIEKINIVLPKVIPDIKLEFKELGKEFQKDSSEVMKLELFARRGDMSIPIKYESAGIIKMISILHALIHAYSNPSVCIVVDELDAGIFEYLLGELLKIFGESAKGQIIFTSHNLRPLEMLNKSNIMFSTSNPKNRYIRMNGVKTNNNLRDLYLRSIILGGQNEDLYVNTDYIEIARAFRKAGRELSNVKNN